LKKTQAILLFFSSLWLQDQDSNDTGNGLDRTRPKDADMEKQQFYLLGYVMTLRRGDFFIEVIGVNSKHAPISSLGLFFFFF
jgi:hypothetical protein